MNVTVKEVNFQEYHFPKPRLANIPVSAIRLSERSPEF